ncbi:hypothetical protein [Streptomyces mirabilis]|uniref:hypothetical protein n=1 Tax=Streptomyces mirabilis TaxID=68239 RepID=UPI0036DEC7AF
MRFLYRDFDPRPRQRTIWKIAPHERGRLWDECRDGGFVCVGWDELGDLSQYQSDTELKEACDRRYPGSSGGSLTLARRLLAFRDLEAGDRIVANRGVDEVLATGTVSGGYRFYPDRPEFQHVVPVTWDVSHAQKLSKPQHGWRSTFAKVDPALFATFTAHRTGSVPGPDQAQKGVPVALPEDVQAVLDALERKGQVILHGPPGTGKTRLALGAALTVAGRADMLGTDPDRRAEAQAEMLQGNRVGMVTFHPSYGYEDFVEGFKPDLSATGPGLTLALERRRKKWRSSFQPSAEDLHTYRPEELLRPPMLLTRFAEGHGNSSPNCPRPAPCAGRHRRRPAPGRTGSVPDQRGIPGPDGRDGPERGRAGEKHPQRPGRPRGALRRTAAKRGTLPAAPRTCPPALVSP